jgi:hypothetical protein
MKEWACNPERDANALGVKQSRHTSEKGKSRGFYSSFARLNEWGLYSIK